MATVAITGAGDALVARVREFLADRESDVSLVHVVDKEEGSELVQQLTGVDAVVHGSSVLVYGAHPDNDVPLLEESPLRPLEDFPAAVGHRVREQALQDWAKEHRPDIPVAVLRAGMIVGMDPPPLLVDAFVGGRILGVRGHRPPFQFLHVDDLAAAFAHAAVHRLDGAYNVACHGWLSADEVGAIIGRHRLELPEEIVFSSAERLRMAGLSKLPLGAVHHLTHPWVVSVDRLEATGWRPEHSNRDALAHLAATHGDRVVFGPVTTTRQEVRQAAGVAAGVTGGLLALGMLARRRRRRREE